MISTILRRKQWLHPFVFAAWTGFLVYLLASRRYVDFLRPEFGLLLAAAVFVAMGFMFAAIIRLKTIEMDVPAVLRALVLLVPVLYFIAMPDAKLGNQAFMKRFIGINNGDLDLQAPSTLPYQRSENTPDLVQPPGEIEDTRQATSTLSPQGPANNPDVLQPPGEIEGTRQATSTLSPQGPAKNPDVVQPQGEIEGIRQETPQEPTILEIFRNPNFYNGKRVIFTGMILRADLLKTHFGGRDTAVYRFLINCCAADALPLAIVLDSDQADAFENDQWVQVDGIFVLEQINGKPIPMVSKPLIKPIETPEVTYLF